MSIEETYNNLIIVIEAILEDISVNDIKVKRAPETTYQEGNEPEKIRKLVDKVSKVLTKKTLTKHMEDGLNKLLSSSKQNP